MMWYKRISLGMAGVFAVVGLIFLVIPDGVICFVNTVSSSFGMAEAPETGFNFFLVLAAGYMYLVTVLAFLVYRHPENRNFSFLLMNAKLASALLSIVFFLFHGRYLIFLANGIIDGGIGILILFMFRKVKGD